MQLEIGKIYEGKVTGITKFGAFVEVDNQTTGMVHISEVANTFVNDISEHLKEGQIVKVKVLNITDENKISMSIKKAFENPRPRINTNNRQFEKKDNQRDYKPHQSGRKNNDSKAAAAPIDPFEDMINKFKKNSEEKMCDLKRSLDGKRKSGSRRSGAKS